MSAAQTGRRPREVLCFTDSATVGGAEHALFMLMSGLDPEVWAPVLVHHGHEELAPLVDATCRAGIPNWRVPPMPEGAEGAGAAVRFAARVRARRPAVFHAHLSWPLACKWPLMAAAAARVPAVVGTVHLVVDVPMGVSRRIQVRALGVAVDRALAVSNDTRARVTSLFGWPAEQVRVVHNAVDLDRFSARPDPALRRLLSGGTTRSLVLVPARLDAQKGHDHLLAASQTLPEIRFLLAGDGPLRTELERDARRLGVVERVVFLGRRDDMPTLMATCDLVVLPSLYEGLPLSVLEAMAASRAVVATDIGGTRELVQSERTGLLVPAGDVAALSAAIRRLAADRNLARRLGEAGRARAATHFSVSAMVTAVEREYRELLGG